MPAGLNVLLPRLFFPSLPPPLTYSFSLRVQIKGWGGGGWMLGGARRRVEKEKKGVNCLPIDNSIITL